MPLSESEIDLRQLGYEGGFDFESIVAAINDLGFQFENVVRLSGPGRLNEFSARASNGKDSRYAVGSTEVETVRKLLCEVLSPKEKPPSV